MSDETEVTSTRSKKFKPPVLLQLFRRSSGAERAAGSPEAAEQLDERGLVLSHLITKYLKLSDLGVTLQVVLRNTSDPVLYDRIALQLAEVRAEQVLCKARYDAIDADQDFTTPPQAAEDALLDAIQAVDRAKENTAAVAELLQAAHGLVVAYAANGTKKQQ